MLGVGLEPGIDSAGLAAALLADGIVVNAPRPDTLRLMPPFVLTTEQADLAVGKVASALSGTEAK